MSTFDALYLYAITDRPEALLPAMSGLEDAPLCKLTYQDLTGVMSFVTTRQIQPTEANLWQHEAIVEALMADRTVLPVRFGTVFSNEATAQAELLTHQTDLIANLKRVRGRVELGLRVLINDEQPPSRAALQEQAQDDERDAVAPTTSAPISRGRAYLNARQEEERQARAARQQAETLAAEIHTALAHLIVESVQQVLVTPRLLLTAAYLVERDRVEAFRQQIVTLSAAYPALSLLCTGPWPPYNFVDLQT